MDHVIRKLNCSERGKWKSHLSSHGEVYMSTSSDCPVRAQLPAAPLPTSQLLCGVDSDGSPCRNPLNVLVTFVEIPFFSFFNKIKKKKKNYPREQGMVINKSLAHSSLEGILLLSSSASIWFPPCNLAAWAGKWSTFL